MALTKVTGHVVKSDTNLTTHNINSSGIVTAVTFVGNVNAGVVTATSFSGDGAGLTGVSGFATALSDDATSPLSKIFKTPNILGIGAGTSITVASDATSGNLAFMRENIISVGGTMHIGSGTTVLTNVLNIF